MMKNWKYNKILQPKAVIFDLGAQNVNFGKENEEKRIEDFIKCYNPKWIKKTNQQFCGGYASEVFKSAGFSYKAVDIYKTKDTIIFDLNHQDLPEELCKVFDMAINIGTTEHIFNQAQVFKVVHDSVKSGGFIYHSLPSMGMLNHGLFKYEPIFFIFLASINDYDVEFLRMSPLSSFYSVPSYLTNDAFLRNLFFGSSSISCLLKKKNENDFRFPLDYDITRVKHDLNKEFFNKYPQYLKLVNDRYHLFRRDINASEYPKHLIESIERLEINDAIDEPDITICPIRVIEATYGYNMLSEKNKIQGSIPLSNGNVTIPIQKLIAEKYDPENGCEIKIDVNYLHDPAPHKGKDLIIHYKKNWINKEVYTAYIDAEAHGKTFKITP